VKHYVGGGLLVLLGALVVVGALAGGNTSPRGWIGAHYAKIADGAYRAPEPPTKVAAALSGKFRPTDRVYDPSGVFLRYPDMIVAVLPDGKGSRVLVDDVETGYRRHHSSVGGRWGGPGGRASMFRGGGPGGGK